MRVYPLAYRLSSSCNAIPPGYTVRAQRRSDIDRIRATKEGSYVEMCEDLFDCIRSIAGLLALVVAPTLLLYLLWLNATT